MKEADGQNLPLLHKEEDSIYFICVKSGKKYYFAGPLSLGELNKVELHKYYKRYGIKAEKERSLKRFQFCIVSNKVMEKIAQDVEFGFWEKYDETHSVIRFATSWATTMEDTQKLIRLLDDIRK